MRSFHNPYPDYNGAEFSIKTEKVTSLIEVYVNQILKKLNSHENDSDGSLYTGTSGIAYMFLKLHQVQETKAIFPNALDNAQMFIDFAKKRLSRVSSDKPALLCGNAGIYAVSCIINRESNKIKESKEDLEQYLSGYPISQKLSYNRYGSDEILFGRAGYLAGIYFLNQHFQPDERISKDIILKICEVIIESGEEYSKSNGLQLPMMWSCYSEKYICAAHGISGILHMLLESPLFNASMQSSNLNEKQQKIKTCIDMLLTMQLKNGNFPCILEDIGKPDHKLIHWCHGAPGVIYVFVKAYLIFKEKKYLDAILLAGDLIWNRGLLRKGPGICHGVAGNGYVFLILYRLTNDRKHLYRASSFAKFLTNETFIKEARTPDCPFSLYEGISGTICFLVDLIQPTKASFPFMDPFEIKF